jgi:hypothetical protein
MFVGCAMSNVCCNVQCAMFAAICSVQCLLQCAVCNVCYFQQLEWRPRLLRFPIPSTSAARRPVIDLEIMNRVEHYRVDTVLNNKYSSKQTFLKINTGILTRRCLSVCSLLSPQQLLCGQGPLVWPTYLIRGLEPN